MKTFALAAIAGLSTALMTSDDYEFISYVAQHNKVYETTEEYAFRMNEWMKVDRHIKLHNNENKTWTLGHNHMSDWTQAERKSINGLKPELRDREYAPVLLEPSNADGVNWVEKGAVTDVKNQGQCGSCWSFSTTGALEGAHFVATGELLSLSEEFFVECDYGLLKNLGCNGGLMDKAFKWAESNAVPLEDAYPYTSGTGTRGSCQTDLAADGKVTVSTYTDVTKNDAAQLKAALDKQPVSVAIEADKTAFQMYTSGVITGTDCGTNLDHGVLAVGYGTEDGTEYFLVKNSWGASWGDKGYVKLGVESTDKQGVCGILSGPPSYPTTN